MGTILSSRRCERGAVAAVVRKDQVSRLSGEDRTDLCGRYSSRSADSGCCGAPSVGKAPGGVTGSAGKTTTKEAIAHVLSKRFRVLKSEGNFNNHFGLPLMLLKIEPEHEAAVIEMGMSHPERLPPWRKLRSPRLAS